MEFGYSLRLLTMTVLMTVTMAAVPHRVRRQTDWNDPDHPFPDSSWSGWTPCTENCGGGYQARHNCTPAYQMPPVGGPVGLEGSSGCFVHTLTCNLYNCDDGFDWQDFSSCDAQCGGGTRTRTSGPDCADVCGGNVVAQNVDCHTHSCTPPSDCGQADVIFILDSSGSVGELNWYRMKQFAIDVSKSLAIGPDASRVAAISYSNEVSLDFDLEAGETIAAVEASLWSIPWMASSTNTADGIRLARGVMASQARDGVKKIMVVVTDGNSNVLEETTLQQAGLARDEGSVIFGVGVSSNINNEELEGISSQPADNFVFHVDSFEALSTITETVASTACAVNDCGPWSEPSPCPVTCGGGLSKRTRTCTEDGQDSIEEEVNVCGSTVCPRTDCSDWELSGSCSVTCGQGQQLYKRECWEVLQDGADGQVFPEEEYRSCSGPVCPCETEWIEGDCSVSCETGTRIDQRTCPTGVETRQVSCSLPRCPCEEEWERGECSVTCGTGTRMVRLVHGCYVTDEDTPIELTGRDYVESCTMEHECLPDCSLCDYGNSIGYIPHSSNCSKYYICERHVLNFQQGEFLYTGPTLRSCAPGTKWDQTILQCVHDWTNECGAVSDPGSFQTGCNYEAVDGDVTKMRSTVDGTVQSCAAGTVFDPDPDICLCVHGYNPATVVCEDDLLLHYTFDDDFNSVTCHTAPAENYGQVVLTPESGFGSGKSAYFDGQSRLVVHFMENYFAGNQIEAFTVALWFRWEGNGGGIQGLVNNGNCEGDPTFDLHVGATQVVSGSMDTTSQPQTSVGEFWTGRNYWQHVALVYDGSCLTFYLNCAYYVTKPLQGPIQNNPDCPMTIGQLGANPDEGLFTGYIDDLRVYTKALSYGDVQGICRSSVTAN